MAYQKAILKNGTRVVLVPHRDTAAATLLVLYEVGSRYETAKLNGAAHFIEHMMFKGTTKRPNTMTISRDLDSVGADYNAFTGKDYTGYYIRLQADKLPLAVDMLDDMVHHSLYREKDIVSERKVIHEEIHMYDDNPMMLVDDLLEEEVFRGSTLGWRISGTDATMNGINRAPMLAFRNAFYVPARTVVAVAGRFDEKEVLKMLEASFGRGAKKREPKSFPKFSVAKAGYRGVRVRLHHKETEQVQVALGWPAYGLADSRLASLSLMSIILGGTMSSRLFLSVREKEGLAYFIRSSMGAYQDVGTFSIQAGLAKAPVHKALGIIMRETAKLKSTLVTTEELTRAKEYVKGKMLLNLEESSNLAEWYAKQELLQRKVASPEEKLARIFAVTREDIRRVAQDILKPSRMTLVAIGPYSEKDKPAFAKHAAAL